MDVSARLPMESKPRAERTADVVLGIFLEMFSNRASNVLSGLRLGLTAFPLGVERETGETSQVRR